uniref:Transglutaminase-like domain-containing protein n=1 Tax=Catharus ustulatus TaxID=91951 RepID=A0A8C3TMK4_CATUS
ASGILKVDLNCPSNCQIHNTHFFGTDRQIIRRGQAFSFYARFQNREWDDSVDQAAFTVETDDPVYLDNQAHREEYVLNEHGILYEGVHKHITSRPWHFGQFEDGILDICLKILDMGASYHHGSDRDHCWRNDPVHVSMVVNHMVRSTQSAVCNENNDYLKGTKPFSWNGSVPILQQWYSGRCRPVRYGYCGSLASVMCTVMRCLGIPSRVVTSFCFPCSIENPLGINEIFDSTGKNLCGKDKLWRYHCWNESWMARRDINQCCGDWQCLDPTPLETGRGSACSGPTWVRSIREGELDLDYDGHHMFSRVNSNYVGWLSQNNAKRTKVFCDTWPCGQRLITKSVGSEQFEDITGAYKYELGLTIKKIFLMSSLKLPWHSFEPLPCFLSLDTRKKSSVPPFLLFLPRKLGRTVRSLLSLLFSKLDKAKILSCSPQDMDVQLNWLLENLRNENKTLKFNLCAQIITYSGFPMDQFWKDSVNVTLGPREVKKIPVCISYNQYGSYLCDHNIMKVVVLLSQPRLKVPCTAEISFCNPLQEDMKNCVMTLEGCGCFASCYSETPLKASLLLELMII